MIARTLLLVVAVGCSPAPAVSTAAPTTTPVPTTSVPPRVIVLVRHAEKVSGERDAALSEIGHARAACLAKTLADLGITHAFTSEFQRTRDTVAPLLAARSVVPEVIAADATATQVAKLHALAPGSIAVVAGHSNTVPALVAALGAGEVGIDDDAYDWMFVISLPERGTPTLLKLHYCPA